MRALTFSMLLLLGFFAAACGASRDDPPKDTSPSTSTGSATQTSTDSSTATDTGRPDVRDVSTYEAFVNSHAATYCNALKTCRALARAGYTDRAACIQAITTQYSRRTCENYQPDAGLRCVQADLAIAQECRDAARDTASDSADTGTATEVDARQPPVCQNVCNPRDTGTGTGTGSSR